MTDLFEEEATTTTSLDMRRLQRHKRRAARRRVTLLVTAVALVVFGLGISIAYNFVNSFESTETAIADYDGPGQGTVQVVIEQGATGADIASTLYEAGVIASTQAFVNEASNNPDAAKITPGYYFMHREMKAEYALAALLDPANRDERTITVVEGKTLDYYYQSIANLTGTTKDDVQAIAEENTEALGLPAEAGGNLEGWLFPDTYVFDPGVTPQDVLAKMIERTITVLDDNGVAPEDRERVLIVASLIEREAKLDEDRPLISSVIYNRLERDMTLDLDSTVNYFAPSEGAFASTEDLETDNPYNTFLYTGLPPGPISGAGEKAIQAAIRPADTDYIFFVTVNLATGETKYSADLQGHNANVEELYAWVEANETSESDG